MKIAFIVGGFPAISETFILNQITGLMDLGCHVEVFAEFKPQDEKVHPDVEKYRLMEHVHYFGVPGNKLARVTTAVKFICRSFRESPRETITTALRSLNILKHGRQALNLTLLYKAFTFLREKHDILYCHFGPNGLMAGSLREIGIQGRIITAFLGSDMTEFLSRKGNRVYERLFRNGDLFLPVCDHFRDKLIQLNCDEGRIVVHRMGVDPDIFKYSEKTIVPGGPFRILTVARLVENKGHSYGLKAVAKLIASHDGVIYTIAGDGPLRHELESLAVRLNITKHVVFLGQVHHDEVLQLLGQAHVFLLPSVTTKNGGQEGTPVSLMEAQASGLPVISTCFSGIPEIVEDGKSGFLVPEKDVDALAGKIEHFIRHPEALVEMGRSGRKIVEERHNIRELNKRLVELFRECIQER